MKIAVLGVATGAGLVSTALLVRLFFVKVREPKEQLVPLVAGVLGLIVVPGAFIYAIRIAAKSDNVLPVLLSELVAAILALGFPTAGWIAPVMIGYAVYRKTDSKPMAWTVGLAVFFAVDVLLLLSKEIPEIGWRLARAWEWFD